jgi:hypothetical protein
VTTDCTNETMRDLLPMLAAGALGASEAAALRGHLSGCAACQAELRLLETAGRVFAAATPRVDVEAIVAKLPLAPSARPALRVVRPTPRVLGLPRYALAAAASLMLVATLSLAILRDRNGSQIAVVDTASDSGYPAAAAVPVSMLGGGDLTDLSAAELRALLAELDQLEATIAAEPSRVQVPLIAAPEEL